VNTAAAGAFEGFLGDIGQAGAPVHDIGGYNYRMKVGAAGLSQHAYGNAIDVDQIGRNLVSADFARWAREHPAELRAALDKWNIISGGDWRNPDFGHFEWAGPSEKLSKALAAQTGAQKPEGDARLNVDVKAPKNTRVRAEADGVFSSVKMNRTSPQLENFE
jgi:hypothetical protein